VKADAAHAYHPLWVTARPAGKPDFTPVYRVLVHRKFYDAWCELPARVGLAAATQFWDHVAATPGSVPALNGSCILRGSAGRPQGAGWSRTIHYEVSSMARINYQYHNSYTTSQGGDPHPVVAILSINYSSH